MHPKGEAFWENIWYCLTPVEKEGGQGCQERGVVAKREQVSTRAIYRRSSPRVRRSSAFTRSFDRQIDRFLLSGHRPSIFFCLFRLRVYADISRLWPRRGASRGFLSLLTASCGCSASWAFTALLRRLTRQTRVVRQSPPVSRVVAPERSWPRFRERPKRKQHPSGRSVRLTFAAWRWLARSRFRQSGFTLQHGSFYGLRAKLMDRLVRHEMPSQILIDIKLADCDFGIHGRANEIRTVFLIMGDLLHRRDGLGGEAYLNPPFKFFGPGHTASISGVVVNHQIDSHYCYFGCR